jgi:hypothetical protein
MKTYNEIAKARITDTKAIFVSFKSICFAGSPNNIAYEIAKMIVENSNDFTKDIAQKWITEYENCTCDFENNDGSPAEYETRLSEKQRWCLAYQIKNNINVYI